MHKFNITCQFRRQPPITEATTFDDLARVLEGAVADLRGLAKAGRQLDVSGLDEEYSFIFTYDRQAAQQFVREHGGTGDEIVRVDPAAAFAIDAAQ